MAASDFLNVVLYSIQMLLAGYIGMTVWKNKCGNPDGAFIVGAFLG